jgi:signal peptidase II
LVVGAAVVAVVVLVDQLTKWWALTRLASGPIHLIGTLDLALSRNTGASFSLFQGKAFLLVPVAVVLVAVLGVMVWRAPTTGRAAILGLIIGGALGNLCDRLFRSDHGAVVDFIALHFWPTFNVADACVVGCLLLLVSLARGSTSR